ncbi:MAG: ATP-grasp domain-containing protein [Lewinella sp.]|nr:ATP-grasp domain-containing protein [Lewinella sp.]
MRKLTIAVTGLNAIDSPGPGVAVIRAIRECQDFDSHIIGLSYESLEPGIYMADLVDKTYQIPYPTAGSATLLARLQYIHDREQLDVIIPNFDAELPNFIQLAPTLREWGIHTFLPSKEQFAELDKLHLHEFGEAHGLQVPKTKFVADAHALSELTEDFDFPMVVKGKYYEAYIAREEADLPKYFNKVAAKWGLPVVIQEFIAGTEIDIAGLGDGQGGLIGAVPIRKLYITDKGKGWAGITLQDDRLLDYTRRFIESSHWTGGFELEIMKREKDDELFLMEVNPRFPAWIYTTAAVGQNLPAALVKLAMGDTVDPYPPYEVGKIFIRYSWELITDIEHYQQIATMGEM